MRTALRNTLLASGFAFSGIAGAQMPESCARTLGNLFSSNTFVSQASGGGAGGTDPVSIVAASDNAFGSNSNNDSGGYVYALAEDFTVPGGGWYVNQLTFYAYQTNSSTTSTLTGVPSLALWNGTPGAGGTVIAGPVAATLVSTSWSGVYRVSSAATTNTQRPIMQITVRWPATFPTLLPAGTYWLQWNETGSLPNLFTPPTVADATDNARYYASYNPSPWNAATDDGSMRVLGYPFVVCGSLDDVIFRHGFEL